ncbi:MAG: ATP-binding protein, partial [Planctomycetia bacterium]
MSTTEATPSHDAGRQEFTFQAEIKQLLHLLAHSLYQSKEIALRELASNASDALDKMRYLSLTEAAPRDDVPLEIRLEAYEGPKQLAVRDTGVGMTRDELVKNLGTIAHSGSLEFLRTLKPNEAKPAAGDEGKPADGKDVSLIGQFGVGFYSAFMLADKVEVFSRSWQSDQTWRWESDGSGSFTVEPAAVGDELHEHGTRILLHLRDDAHDFCEPHRLKSVLKKYSSFLSHPITLR